MIRTFLLMFSSLFFSTNSFLKEVYTNFTYQYWPCDTNILVRTDIVSDSIICYRNKDFNLYQYKNLFVLKSCYDNFRSEFIYGEFINDSVKFYPSLINFKLRKMVQDSSCDNNSSSLYFLNKNEISIIQKLDTIRLVLNNGKSRFVFDELPHELNFNDKNRITKSTVVYWNYYDYELPSDIPFEGVICERSVNDYNVIGVNFGLYRIYITSIEEIEKFEIGDVFTPLDYTLQKSKICQSIIMSNFYYEP